MESIDRYASPKYVVHLPGAPPLDKNGMKQFGNSFFQAFPDLKHEIPDCFASGDRVAVRLRISGKHTKDLVGPSDTIPPSGRDVDFEAMNIWRIVDGKAVEHWVMFV